MLGLMSADPPREPLDYTSTVGPLSPAAAASRAEVILGCKYLIGAGLCLLLWGATTDFWLVPLLATLWIVAALPLTPFLLFEGIFYCSRAARAGFPPPHSMRRALTAALLPIAVFPLGYALVRVSIVPFFGGSWI